MESQKYFDELLSEAGDVSEETAYDSYYTQYTTPDSMDCASDNLLVTFDYGYSDSVEALSTPPAAYGAEDDSGADADGAIWFGTGPSDAKAFEVHHVQHAQQLLEESLPPSMISYDVDDFEEQSEPESDSDSELEPDMDEHFYDSIEC